MTVERPLDPPPSGGERPSRPRVAVVGAGITGLAAALRILRAAPAVEVSVYEASRRPGGVIATERGGERGEYLVEAGPDSFLTEKPEALRFCEELGIAGRLIGIQPAAARTYVVHRGRLMPVPDGFRIVAPARLATWLGSPLFSWVGKARMALDLVLPAGRCLPDESVASFVQRRLGREAFDRIAEPMIGTIYTADAAALSLAATMPRFLELERRYGSVIRGLMRSRAAADSHVSGSRDDTARHSGRRVGMFATLSDGMQALVNAAAGTLPAASLHVRTPVSSLAHASDGGGYRLALAGSAGGIAVVEVDAVVIATSAPAAARLLAGVDERLAAGLSAIRYASSASVTLAYRRTEVRHPLDGAGFVVPRKEGRPVLAASFSSVKFPGRAPEGRALLRVFVGGALAPDLVDRDDDALVAVAHREIETLLGAAAPPIFARVHRHRDAMPQYTVGHLARVAEIEGRLAGHHGLALAGAAYRGVGISDCIRSGEAAAEQVLVHVRQRGFTVSGVRP